MKRAQQTRLQHLLAIVLVLGIVVIINILCHFVRLRIDLSEDKEFTLSESTSTVLNRLEDQLTIKLYYSKNLPGQILPTQQRVADLLDELKAAAKQGVIIESRDPDSSEEKERETLALGIVPVQLNVIEKDRQEVKKIYMGLTLTYRDKSAVIPAITDVQNLEYVLALNILKFSQGEPTQIGLYIGNNKERYQLISEIIRQIGAVVPVADNTKDLDTQKLSSLVVVEPTNVNPDLVKQWDGLLNEGINIIIFSGLVDVDDKMQASTFSSGIDDWLATKAAGVNGALLVDPMQNARAVFRSNFGVVSLPYPFWVRTVRNDVNADHPITGKLEEIVFPWTNTVQLLLDEQNSWTPTVLVKSSRRSFLQPEEEPNIDPYYVSQMKELPVFESYPMSVVFEKKQDAGIDQKTGRIFLAASHGVVRDDILQRNQSNAVFLANMLEYASWGNELIGIRSRGQASRTLKNTSATERATIKWGLMFGVPLLTIILGILSLWILKKRRQGFVVSLTR